MKTPRKFWFALAVIWFAAPLGLWGQFRDDFDGTTIEGWFAVAGDGDAKVEVVPMNGFARLKIDATADHHVVWYTFIKRDVTDSLDLTKLADPAYELRVEARVRTSVAPRRVNFMLNTSRTTDYHEHLREYDLAKADTWEVISFTTDHFDAKPGDRVFVQFCATDFGPDRYNVDVDYYRADVVKKTDAKSDLGEPLVYHPAVPALGDLIHHEAVAEDSLISQDFPTVNLNNWHQTAADGSQRRLLTVSGNQWAVLRWNFNDTRGQRATSPGVLELTTVSVAEGGNYGLAFDRDLAEEFGKVRIIEILAGETDWMQDVVSYHSLTQGKAYADVFNTQMVIDLEPNPQPGGKTRFVLNRRVMQRLIDGETQGLLIRPLGAITASFVASEDASGDGPVLHFSTAP